MKYQALYDALTKYTGIVVDLGTNRLLVKGYAVFADSDIPVFTVPVDVADSDAEAFDTMIERALVACRYQAATHLLVRLEDDNDIVSLAPMFATPNKEFALGWACAHEDPYIWNVDKRKEIPITPKLESGFWIGKPGPVVAEGAKS